MVTSKNDLTKEIEEYVDSNITVIESDGDSDDDSGAGYVGLSLSVLLSQERLNTKIKGKAYRRNCVI